MSRDLRAVAEFRRWKPLALDLAADIHPERWRQVGITPAAAARLAQCRRSRRTLSEHIGWIAPDAPDRWRPWLEGGNGTLTNDALRSGEELWRIGLRLGAGRFREDMARLVWRNDVSALKAAIGEDAYLFAMRQAAMLWRDARLEDGGDAVGALAERVTRSAALGMECWLAELPPELAARTRLKLPLLCDEATEVVAGWPRGRRDGWLEILGRLFG